MSSENESHESPAAGPDNAGAHPEKTGCCVVGGGPAGAVLALLLARKGVPVTLLESHHDFEREFRGDTLHPSTMEVMDQLGLAGQLLALPHTKLQKMTIQSASESGSESFTFVDLTRLKTPFPYVTLMPQAQFLEFVTTEAKRYPWFELRMGASAQSLIQEHDVYQGVRYQQDGEEHELQAPLTVAADGRFSRLRKLVGFEQIKASPPMDVLWFRLSRREEETVAFGGRAGGGRFLIVLPRVDHYQVGYVIAKGTFHDLKEQGIEAFHESLCSLAPEFTDRVGELDSWTSVTPLSVEAGRLEQWWLPGLLFIGDAAHVMSPVGGVGINCAIQDAVVAANVLHGPLLDGHVPLRRLATVQSERSFPTRVIQTFQSVVQNRLAKTALNPNATLRPPFVLRLPFLRDLPARIFGFGVSRVRVV